MLHFADEMLGLSSERDFLCLQILPAKARL
jgi:hypothetical protein